MSKGVALFPTLDFGALVKISCFNIVEGPMELKKIVRVVCRGVDGSIASKDYQEVQELMNQYEQIGLDDCSTDLTLRGMPLFRGLIGPISESKSVVIYESPDVFEYMTKEWSQTKIKRKRRSRAEIESAQQELAKSEVPIPKMNLNLRTGSATVNS